MNPQYIYNFKVYCILDIAIRDVELTYPIFFEDDFRNIVLHCLNRKWITKNGSITDRGYKYHHFLMQKLKLKKEYRYIYPDFRKLNNFNASMDDVYLP